MTQYDIGNLLDFSTVTSFHLYGTPTPPAELFDRAVPRDDGSVVINIDASKFMKSGPRQYFYLALQRSSTEFINTFPFG